MTPQIASLVTPFPETRREASVLRRWLVPSSPLELLCFALILWLIGYSVTGDGGGLLRDSQTGYHIRVGEYVLTHHNVPTRDFLSFTKPGQPFFAWEWLAGVGAAVLYDWSGLRALIVVSALLVGVTILLMMRHLVWRGANILLTIFLIHLAIGASSIHYLARPHLFTFLSLAIALWILDRDRRQSTPLLWILVPLTMVWANLHGGFFGLLVSTGILSAGSAAEWLIDREPKPLSDSIRYAALTAACFMSSLVNPYGIQEHFHLLQFMRETWYLKLTEEYQPPHLLTAAGGYYGILLAGGLIVAARLLRRRQIAPALLILAWAYASSRSMRHIPIYAMVVLPSLAGELVSVWDTWISGKPRKSLAGIMRTITDDYQPSLGRSSLFLPVTAAVLLLCSFGIAYPGDFPEPLYPASLVTRHSAELAQARVFTTDSWGHYLTFRYPEPYGIYIDGRCDFFGQRFTDEYLAALNGQPGWQDTLRRYGVQAVLLPPKMALAMLLRGTTGWRVVEDTSSAVLFSSQ